MYPIKILWFFPSNYISFLCTEEGEVWKPGEMTDSQEIDGIAEWIN